MCRQYAKSTLDIINQLSIYEINCPYNKAAVNVINVPYIY